MADEGIVMTDEDEELRPYHPPRLLVELAESVIASCAEQGVDSPAAERTMSRIWLDFGEQGLYFTITHWADLTLDAVNGRDAELDARGGGKREVQGRGVLDSLVTVAGAVNPPAAWACQFVLARADWDITRMADLYFELRQQEWTEAEARLNSLMNLTLTALTLAELKAMQN